MPFSSAHVFLFMEDLGLAAFQGSSGLQIAARDIRLIVSTSVSVPLEMLREMSCKCLSSVLNIADQSARLCFNTR